MRKLAIVLVALAALTSAQTVEQGLKIGPNTVHVTLRHCQPYMHSPNWLARTILHRQPWIDSKACAADPSTVASEQFIHNLKTNSGVDYISQQVSGPASTSTAQWIALSTSNSSPLATDVSLPSEVVGNGLSRAQGTYAHTNGTTTYTVTFLFTASGSQSGIWKMGLLTASSSGTLVYEVLLSQSVSVNSGDQVNAVWTVTVS